MRRQLVMRAHDSRWRHCRRVRDTRVQRRKSRYCVRACVDFTYQVACMLVGLFFLLLDHGLGHVRQEVYVGPSCTFPIGSWMHVYIRPAQEKKEALETSHGKKRQRSPILFGLGHLVVRSQYNTGGVYVFRLHRRQSNCSWKPVVGANLGPTHECA